MSQEDKSSCWIDESPVNGAEHDSVVRRNLSSQPAA